MYVVDEVGGGVRPENNLGVAGMRIYRGVGEGGLVKTPGNFRTRSSSSILGTSFQKNLNSRIRNYQTRNDICTLIGRLLSQH